MAESSLQAIRYQRGSLALLDQRKLPLESIYIDIPNCEAGWHAIKDMVVRGAPAIAIAAALSLAVELTNMKTKPRSAEAAILFIQKQLDYLLSSRPTAVNLFEAASKLKNVAEKAAASGLSADEIFEGYVEAAESMLVADVCSNKAIGMFGATEVLNEVKLRKPDLKLRILTHCNTGSLATAAYGTALGIIRAIHSQGKIETVYCTETRPYNQGSRLTAYELVHEKIPAVLIADSAAASLTSLGKVDAIIVGADRIACNGDTANKIGTYNLAVSAFYHNIPFYVAAPLTSIDISLPSGESIVIEERQPEELTHALGGHGPQIAANGIGVWNPAFDITPAKLITAIVTDKGVIKRENGSSFNISDFLMETQNEASCGMILEDTTRAIENNGVAKHGKAVVDVGKGNGEFYILNEKHVPEYISQYPQLVERLGGRSEEWTIKEVGDGNLNFVYIVAGPNRSLVLKQAVPYIRCVGESWPMTSDRSYYETRALKEHGSLCPDHVPEVYHFDRVMSAIVMRYIEPPHIILRKGLIAGIIYPLLAQHMSDYMAKTLFHTSLIANSTKTQKLAVSEFCSNLEMCRLTEQVIFTEPYMQSPNNHWTSPYLDGDAKELCEDTDLKLEVAELKAKFCEKPQALLHGDLHTGSIMVTVNSTQVIDPEFAFYGPIGFDIGAFLGNLALSFFSQDGHANSQNDRQDYRDWILLTIAETWDLFEKKFIALWDASWGCSGDAYPGEVYKTSEDRKAVMNRYLKEVFQDTLGFAAAKMIRRVVGIAHVEDLESIENLDVRARCERRTLNFAKAVMKERHSIPSIAQVIDMLREFASSTR